MKTVGEVIKEVRMKKGLSRAHLGSLTKIKKDFIRAIEEENWGSLPEYPVVSGFVGSLAGALDMEKDQVMALLRRDYPPKTIKLNPNPDVGSKFVWTPRLTFILGVVIILVVALGYLGFQYFKFITPPVLEVGIPEENAIITKSPTEVGGKTTFGSVVEVNNQPVIISENGDFTTEIEVSEETQEIVVKATSRSGKETTLIRKIKVEFK